MLCMGLVTNEESQEAVMLDNLPAWTSLTLFAFACDVLNWDVDEEHKFTCRHGRGVAISLCSDSMRLHMASTGKQPCL